VAIRAVSTAPSEPVLGSVVREVGSVVGAEPAFFLVQLAVITRVALAVRSWVTLIVVLLSSFSVSSLVRDVCGPNWSVMTSDPSLLIE